MKGPYINEGQKGELQGENSNRWQFKEKLKNVMSKDTLEGWEGGKTPEKKVKRGVRHYPEVSGDHEKTEKTRDIRGRKYATKRSSTE